MDEFDFINLFLNKINEKRPNWYVKGIIDSDNNIITLYNGSVVKTKIKDFYNEPICMVVGG